MKKLFSLFHFFIFCLPHNGVAQLRSTTSEVFELSSIVFRLAGAEEYLSDPIPSYANEIDKYFAPFADHELIGYVREIRGKFLIGYDAVANAAAYLVLRNGEIALDPTFDAGRIREIDDRWTTETYGKYVNLLNDFYKDCNFKKFYSDHRKLYNVATDRADKLLKNINTEWFDSFFGEDLGNVRIVVSLCNGNVNYAFSLLNKNNGFGIVIGCRADAKGKPAFSVLMPQTIIHELLHGYTNKLIYGIWDEIEPAALKIYPHVAKKMLEIAIGFPKNVMAEWFTDLCADMYFRDNEATKGFSLAFRIAQQQKRGFIWMEKSVEFMNGFYENRDQYPTVKDYMPRIVEFINDVADNFGEVIAAYENLHPRILEIIPAPNSTVALNTDRIVIKFSEPMSTDSYGYGRTKEEGVLTIPTSKGDKEFWRDDMTFVIPIKSNKLLPNKKYGLYLGRDFFTSTREYPLAEDYTIIFNTSEQ